MSILDLPIEILENIFRYCNNESFINLTFSCNRLYNIYKSYGIKSIPKYVGIIKFNMRYPRINHYNSEEDSEEDGEEDGENNNYFSTFTKEKIKYIVTQDIDTLYHFFFKYCDGDYVDKEYINRNTFINGKPKKIKFYFSKFELGEKISLNDMYEFRKCILDFSTRRDRLNRRLFNDYINNNGLLNIPLYKPYEIVENREIEKIKFFSELDYIKNNDHKLNYIKKFLGKDKLEENLLLLKTIVKENSYYSFNYNYTFEHDLINITSMRFIKDKDTDLIKEDIADCELLFKLKYPFINEYKTDFNVIKIKTNQSNDL